jgi:hypothetical protein
MGSKAWRRQQAQIARAKAKAARQRGRPAAREAIADDLRRHADFAQRIAAETSKLAELGVAAQREQDRTWARFEAIEAAALARLESPPRGPSKLARRLRSRFEAAERAAVRAEQAAVRAEQAAAESARAALESPPRVSLARRLSIFTRNLRIDLAFALTLRRMRREGRRREALGREIRRRIRAAQEAVKRVSRSAGGSTRAPREAITAAVELLEEARGEQRALVRQCGRAQYEIGRWEELARHALTQGREKTAKRALARRNRWARSFRHQVLEAEKQQAALAAHDSMLLAVAEELERQTASA